MRTATATRARARERERLHAARVVSAVVVGPVGRGEAHPEEERRGGGGEGTGGETSKKQSPLSCLPMACVCGVLFEVVPIVQRDMRNRCAADASDMVVVVGTGKNSSREQI